jgi:glucosamine--fructose-6-phosphate aminotransferase (isomerizing)
MCGIVGGISDNIDWRSFLLEGLKKLDYRGYDSAGLAFQKNLNISVYKTVGRVSDLDAICPKFSGASAGIAHTRWATHGVPNTINAHPQTSFKGYISIVHNGVVENYRALKNKLKEQGYTFKSETDTEVIADLIESFLCSTHDMIRSIELAMRQIEGSYAVAFLCKGDSNLYFMKKASPLLIGVSEQGNFLASDPAPMIKVAKKFIDLNDGDYGFMSKDKVHLFHDEKEIQPTYSERHAASFTYDLQGYPYFMLKEIEEAPSVIERLLSNYFDGKKWTINSKITKAIMSSDDVVFLACGTSYYASLIGVEYMHYLGKRSEAYIASEWAYYPVNSGKKPLYILLTQSGETADLILCQKYINSNGLTNIAITNTEGSTIERKATFSILLYAGLEVAVASTKSYVAQVSLLAILVAACEKKNNAARHLRVLETCLKDIISRKEEIHALAKIMYKASDAFYVGRGFDYSAALECSLKLKEVSYIHAEAYPAGELKHGPIALIQKETPVIGLISDQLSASSTRNNLVELSSRGATVFIISTQALKADGDNFSTLDVKAYLSSLPKVMIGQYLSYFVALEKGLPIDKPRNLAKSVTVE